MVVKVVHLFGIATFTVTDTTLAVPISMRITTTSSPMVVERTQVQEATTWSPMNSDSVCSLLMVLLRAPTTTHTTSGAVTGQASTMLTQYTHLLKDSTECGAVTTSASLTLTVLQLQTQRVGESLTQSLTPVHPTLTKLWSTWTCTTTVLTTTKTVSTSQFVQQTVSLIC